MEKSGTTHPVYLHLTYHMLQGVILSPSAAKCGVHFACVPFFVLSLL